MRRPVDLWLLDRRHAFDRAGLEDILSPDERSRGDQYRLAADRDRHMLGRAVARLALSGWTGVPPQRLRLETDARGRPHLAGVAETPGFNISHSGSLVACAIGAGGDIGVDVEAIRPEVDTAVAERVCTPAERRMLAAAGDAGRAAMFATLWTCKEAYAKALGLGLALDFARLGFLLSDDGPRPEPSGGVGPGWIFQTWEMEGHRIALATGPRTGPGRVIPRDARALLPCPAPTRQAAPPQ